MEIEACTSQLRQQNETVFESCVSFKQIHNSELPDKFNPIINNNNDDILNDNKDRFSISNLLSGNSSNIKFMTKNDKTEWNLKEKAVGDNCSTETKDETEIFNNNRTVSKSTTDPAQLNLMRGSLLLLQQLRRNSESKIAEQAEFNELALKNKESEQNSKNIQKDIPSTTSINNKIANEQISTLFGNLMTYQADTNNKMQTAAMFISNSTNNSNYANCINPTMSSMSRWGHGNAYSAEQCLMMAKHSSKFF